VALTLVPEGLAQPGFSFTFRGPNRGEECQGCPVQKLCFNLEPGLHYRVTAVRDVRHPCNLHDEGRVRVVQVEEAPFMTSLETKHLRGTAATWSPVPCGMPECPQNSLCHPVGPVAGARCEIVEDGGTMTCPAGFDIHRVALKRLPGPVA